MLSRSFPLIVSYVALHCLRSATLHAWVLVTAADYPAAASLGPWVGSTSAWHPCRHCTWRRPVGAVEYEDEAEEDEPNANVAGAAPVSANERRGLTFLMQVPEHNWSDVSTALTRIKNLKTKRERTLQLSLNGFNTTVFPLDPSWLPEVDPTRMQPQDVSRAHKHAQAPDGAPATTLCSPPHTSHPLFVLS